MVFVSKLRAFPSRTISSLRERLSSAAPRRSSGFIGVPVGAGGPPGFFSPQMFSVSESGSSSSDNLYLAARRVSDRLMQMLDTGGNRYQTPRELTERYQIQFSDGIREGNVDRLDSRIFDEAIKILRFNLVIEENAQGMRLYKQVSRINEIATGLSAQLPSLKNLHDLVKTVILAYREFPENLDLYLYDQKNNELIKAGTTSTAKYESNYSSWLTVKEKGIFDIVINSEGYRGGSLRLTECTRAEGPIFPEDFNKYHEVFKEPDEVRFQRGRDEGERVVLVTKRHNWKTKQEEGGNLRLYSKNAGAKEVDAAWDAFDQVIASAIGRIVKDKAVKDVWMEEAREIEAMHTEARGIGAGTFEMQEARLYALAQKRGSLKRISKRMEIARIFPSSLVETAGLSEKTDLVRGLGWTGRTEDDLRKHLETEEIAVVFDRGRPISFATVEESNFNNESKHERILTLVGTMVRKGYYGLGLQTYMYFRLMLRRWLRYKFEGGLAKPLRLIMRTRSVGAAVGFLEHFSEVKFNNLSRTEKRRAFEYSERLGQRCNDEGVVVQAYDKSPRDKERDQVLLNKVERNNPALYRRVNEAINDLPETHARIFQGKWPLWKIFRDWLYVRFVLTRRLARHLDRDHAE